MSESKVLTRLQEGYQVLNQARTHEWMIDEPVELGGKNSGAEPTEHLLSAISACMTITMKMYAERKEWDLQSASVELKLLERGGAGKKSMIEKKVVVLGSLDEDQKKRLLDISGRCPTAKLVADSFEFVWAS